MIEISIQKRSKVFFDESEEVYIKYFYPKFKFKLKYFFKFRKYPGCNFKYISDTLNSLNFKTPKILEYSNYFIKTKKVDGITLDEYIKNNPNDKTMLKNFINFIVTIYFNNIYSGDLHLKNFLVSNNELYILDLEDYRHTKVLNYRKKEFLRRLKTKIPPNIYNLILEEIKNSKV